MYFNVLVAKGALVAGFRVFVCRKNVPACQWASCLHVDIKHFAVPLIFHNGIIVLPAPKLF